MKKAKLNVLFLCAVLLLAPLMPAPAQAEGSPVVAYIESDITTDTTWEAGEYYICHVGNREPIVTNGATLTIESGARVYFSTDTNTLLPNTIDKYPYSHLTVTNGSLQATGVTFTTVPDASGETTWQDKGWAGIQAKAVDATKPATLSFTDCIFEYSTGSYTLYGVDTNGAGDGQTVNISVSGCTFRNPIITGEENEFRAAIRYNNGAHLNGKGNLSVSNSNFTGYTHGVFVGGNSRDDIDIAISGCTFSDISIMPVTLHSGRSASVTGCTFNNIHNSRDGTVYIFNDIAPTSKDQTVTLTGNTFNGNASTVTYPVVVGANVQINKDISAPVSNTFNVDYPAAYRYIQLTNGIGSTSTTNPTVENATWGVAGIPYLLTNSVKVSGNGTKGDGIHSTLTMNPGVTVYFNTGVNLTIDGMLKAEGTAESPITFRKKDGVEWCDELSADGSLESSIVLKHCIMDGLDKGVDIGAVDNATADPLVLLENCVIQNTRYPVNLCGKNITVRDCEIGECGVNINNNGRNVELENCTITVDGAKTETGVIIENGEGITLQGCSITSGGGNGVSISNAKAVTLKNCLVAGFSGHGIVVIQNTYETLAAGAPLIENCTVASNGLAGVIFTSYSYGNLYGAFISNSIIAENGSAVTELPLDLVCDETCISILDESIAYSFIGRDEAPFTEETYYVPSHYEHSTFGRIAPIPEGAYVSRVAGPAHFADATNGDYHLKSASGRWNGSAWVNDAVTSNCINTGDPDSPFANEPLPNGGRINLGCYGNTVEASKSGSVGESYTVTLPDGKIDGGWIGYAAAAYGSSASPVAHGDSFSFTITVGGAFYKTDAFKVKANNVELTAVENGSDVYYTISSITENQTITVEGVALIDTPVIITQPVDQSVNAGQEAVFNIVASGYNPEYSWRVNKNDENGWVAIDGATGAQYKIAAASLSQNGWQYCCIVTSRTAVGSTFNRISNTVTLTVQGTSQPTTYSISVSTDPAAAGTVSGGGTYSENALVTLTAAPNTNYRFAEWIENSVQVSTVASYSFTATANRMLVAVFESYEPDPPAGENGVSGVTPGGTYATGGTMTFTASGAGMDNTNPKTGDKRWLPVAWTTNPSGDFATGFTQSFSTDGMSMGAHTLIITFQHQSYNGSAWVDISGETSQKSVSYTLSAAAVAPSITGQPRSSSVTEGTKAVFSVTATGTAPLSYQWQVNNGSGWQDIGGADKAQYTLAEATLSQNSWEYRCSVSNSAGSATSNAATLTVKDTGLDLPVTGGNTLPWLWPSLALLCAGLAAVTVRWLKSRRTEI